ncbi:MAG: DUF1801 domain-containing protein [Mycetocola sp.]
MSSASSSKRTPTDKETAAGFSAEERAAMKVRAAEIKAEAKAARTAQKAAADASVVLAKIADMAQPDRALAERVHQIITATAPQLAPKLWYGQPAYALDGVVICFFRSGLGDKERYSTLGFSSAAALDDASGLWPSSYALTELTDEAEATIASLVTRAVTPASVDG